MIHLARSPKPRILEENAEEWTRDALAVPGPLSALPDATRYRYRHADVKETVKRDSYEKCMYCESKITQVHPGEIDHILPASERRDLIVEWENLGYVCSACNLAKHAYYDPDLPLLDPYADEPSEHLRFYGPMVLHRTGSPRGELTVKRLKLSERKGLFERRAERIRRLKVLLDRIDAMQPGPLRVAVESSLQDELANEQEYAATARAFVDQERAASRP